MANNSVLGKVVAIGGGIVAAIVISSTLSYTLGRGLGERNTSEHVRYERTLSEHETLLRALAEDRTRILTRLEAIPSREEVRQIVKEAMK